MANNLTCKECAYLWREEGEKYPSCQYRKISEWDLAPCEIDEYEEEPEEDYSDMDYEEEKPMIKVTEEDTANDLKYLLDDLTSVIKKIEAIRDRLDLRGNEDDKLGEFYDIAHDLRRDIKEAFGVEW